MATDSISLTYLARPSYPLSGSGGSVRSIGRLARDCLVRQRVETFARLRMVNRKCRRSIGPRPQLLALGRRWGVNDRGFRWPAGSRPGGRLRHAGTRTVRGAPRFVKALKQRKRRAIAPCTVQSPRSPKDAPELLESISRPDRYLLGFGIRPRFLDRQHLSRVH